MKKTVSIILAAGLVLAPTAAHATGGGHDPVSVCHNGKTLTMDRSALQAHLSHGDTEGECAPKPTTKPMKWFLPNGGTPQNVTWPQPIFTNQCGGFVQVDVYPYTSVEDKARTDALDDDGVLSYGEDHGWVKSWSFEKAPDCEVTPDPEPTPEPTPDPMEDPTSPPTETPTEQPSPEPAAPAPKPSEETQPVVSQPSTPSVEQPAPEKVATPEGRTELAVTGAKTNLALLAAALISTGIWLKRRTRRV